MFLISRDSFLSLGVSLNWNLNALKVTPLKRSSIFGLKISPVCLANIWSGVTFPPNTLTACAARDLFNASLTALFPVTRFEILVPKSVKLFFVWSTPLEISVFNTSPTAPTAAATIPFKLSSP